MSSKRPRVSTGMPWRLLQFNAQDGAAKKPIVAVNHSALENARIVVGIDFGTTFSGFAYALASDPDKVFTFYDWSCQAAAGSKPYCKTQTSLWYLPGKIAGSYEMQHWGWPAYVNHRKALQAKRASTKIALESTEDASNAINNANVSSCGHFLTKFKLHLAADGSSSGPQLTESVPKGLSVERVISDYLKHFSIFIMEELRNKFGSDVVKKHVQWCLTVPAMWNDAAKQTMEKCAQMAGLVDGRHCRDPDASPHRIIIVLEPEAASVYCQRKLTQSQFRKGSKFLVVDAGGGTVDLVVHEKVDDSGVRVKEVACSTGDLCGGTFVDKAFMNFLCRRIGPFEKFSADFPATTLTLNGLWENLKCSFDGNPDPYDLELPAKLASVWETDAKSKGSSCPHESDYDEVTITGDDMKSIFDGEVNKILQLIKDQLALVPGVEAIMVVGGFSNSPYLMKRIRDTFSTQVKQIISPTDPGSAVCQGAVAFGALGAEIMMSRKSRKTYGISVSRPFKKGDPSSFLILDDDGEAMCKNDFLIFVRVGDDVPVDHSVTHDLFSFYKSSSELLFRMYSTSKPEPAFVTDAGVEKVGSWTYTLPPESLRMDEKPELDVTMYFGRTRIELVAKPRNFKGEEKFMLSVVFERDIL